MEITMKKLSLLSLFLATTLILSSCGSIGYEIKPGEQADFETRFGGVKVISHEIEDEPDYTNIIQQPGAFFLKESRGSSNNTQGADYVFSAGAQAYMDMLVNVYGFEKFYENLGYVYNTWYFVHPNSGKETGNYGSGYDVMVRHYYDASTSTTRDWLDVSIDTELFSFGDLGLRANKEYEREPISGKYAKDAFLLQNEKYYNSSDGRLSVRSGIKKETLYTYTRPFASRFYGFYGYDGVCSLIINGEKPQEYDALISDYEDFNSSSTDMIFVSKKDGSKLLGITWEHDKFGVGKTYNLYEFNKSSLYSVTFNYDYGTFTEDDAICLTVRPIWIDRSGACESVVYFYFEFENDEGNIYTVEGLLAAPFCLEENSEKYEGESSGNSGGSSGVPNSKDPYIPDHSKLDCLTCGGDGDCNNCNGYGEVKRYAGAGDYVRASCTSCYGSGNCRTCGGSGNR